MKKIALLIFSLLAIATTGFADVIYLDNQSPYPNINEKSKLAIQWAASAKEVDAANQATMHGQKLDPKTVQVVNDLGKVKLTVPEKAEHFRVLVWSNGQGEPDLHTNWVDVVPNKIYTLKTDHLIPVLLMIGMGC
ncbi:MAG: hypothetical protein JSR57_07325 [Verrucomicrobia bacterium]|nr:hypothetical protein [Verrucomicrobiota bacterium]